MNRSAQAHPPGIAATAMATDSPMQSILIVEDDPITARYLELGLKRMGYANTRIAGSSETALDLVREEAPDLALMDIQIEGGRDGIDTARVLRERFDVPVIFLTGLADEPTMERARDADPLGYLVKPVKAEDLRAALKAAFQKESLTRTMRERDQWLGGMLETLGEAMLGCSTSGRVEFANSTLRQLLELPQGKPLQQDFAELVTLNDADGQQILDPNKLAPGEISAVLVRPSGEVKVQLSVGRVFDLRNRPLGVVLVLRVTNDHVALEAELRRLRAELSSQSLTDDLTGLYNRRGFNVLGDQQLKLSKRGRTSISVLQIALAGVKEINDTYGRDAGDQSLRDLAAVLRETFRESDVLSRLGGGEFAVFANTPDTAEMLNRLHANVAACNDSAGRAWLLAINVGAVTHQPKEVQRIPELLEAAGRKLREVVGE